MARPKLELDESLIEKLATIHCQDNEIANIVGCSVDTLHRRYADLIAKGKDKGRSTLRRYQWDLASKGNATMLIWLGKQLLGQTDKSVDAEVTDPNLLDRIKKLESMSEEELNKIAGK